MPEAHKHNFIKGAAILAAASVFVKIIGAVYQIPLIIVIGVEGAGHHLVIHNVFMMMLTLTTTGITIALSRVVSSAVANGETVLAKRYFAVALPTFIIIGVIATAIMYFFADPIAIWQHNSLAAPGIRVLAPAILFACVVAVYRGYLQGLEYMVPTAVTQSVEVVVRSGFGIIVAVLLTRAYYESNLVAAGAITGITISIGVIIPMLMWFKHRVDKRLMHVHNADNAGKAEKSTVSLKLDESPEKESMRAAVTSETSAQTEHQSQSERSAVLSLLMRVSIPISLGASCMTIMNVINQSIILGRLQEVFLYTEQQTIMLFGMYSQALRIYNLPPAIFIPLAVAIVPALAVAIAKQDKNSSEAIMKSAVKLVSLIAMPAAAGMMVLASPILIALFGDGNRLTADILIILGVATFLLCLQIVTTAILQAHGHERAAMLTFPIGAVIKLVVGYFLVAVPGIGILGSPIGTVACFLAICIINFMLIHRRVGINTKFTISLIKPLLCTLAMAVAAYATYMLSIHILSGTIERERLLVIFSLVFAIFIAMLLYGVLIILTRTITMEEMRLLPKGEKIAKFLRIR